MSDLGDRLRALDPAAAAPYQHQDLESLIARITAQPQVVTQRWWRHLELKVASFLVAGSLVVAGSLALVEGAAPTLPALSLAPTHANFAPTAVKLGAIEVNEQFDFHATAAIAATAPSSPSYPLTIPSDASREAARVAAVFGVAGTPVDTNGDGTDWTVRDASGASLDYENSGVPQWYYSSSSPTVAPATASDAASTPVPSDATVASDVAHYVAALGYGYTLAAANFATSTVSTTSASGAPRTISTAEVTYQVVVAGVSTDQSVSFTVNAQNDVLYASGPALRVGAGTNYPLQSPLAGVSALNAQQRAKYAGSTSASTTPVVEATLTSDTVTLATYQLTDGSLWLLPVYDYHGEVTTANGATSSGSWSELAVDPAYTQVGSTSPTVNPDQLKF
jgi:hypothetical protein